MDFNRIWRGGRGFLEDLSRISRIPRGFLDDLASKTMNSRPAGARRDWPELAGAGWARPELAGLGQSWLGSAEPARRPQKSHFWQMASGLDHRGVGTPYLFHTFQRRSNRGRATILDGSTDGDEISVKGKSLVPPIFGAPTVAANGNKLQSETHPLIFDQK